MAGGKRERQPRRAAFWKKTGGNFHWGISGGEKVGFFCFNLSHTIHVWDIYLHEWLIFMVMFRKIVGFPLQIIHKINRVFHYFQTIHFGGPPLFRKRSPFYTQKNPWERWEFARDLKITSTKWQSFAHLFIPTYQPAIFMPCV